jgi:uncharacterized protein (DUF433 family)
MISAVKIDKHVLGGTPCFAGTRVPIKSLFDHLKLGYTIDRFIEQFPTVRRELVDQVLESSLQKVVSQEQNSDEALVG